MPRAKRSKQYRKLMDQFSMGFGFRVPYQVLVDADFLQESHKCKMDVVKRLEDTLHGEVKPMITQCSMRHLYARDKTEPGVQAAIDQAKTQFERRRCGHHPDEYPEPLSAFECVNSVVDPKNNRVNKHRYVCAINDEGLRASLRHITGVPLIYIRRSVVLMEPMATVSAKARSREERSKFRAEIKMPGGKRKREEEDSEDEDKKPAAGLEKDLKPEKKRKKAGPKGPNPLSVKKKKKRTSNTPSNDTKAVKPEETPATEGGVSSEASKKKRRRKHKTIKAEHGESSTANEATAPVAEPST